MICNDNFIEYIGLENHKDVDQPPIKNFIDKILEFDNFIKNLDDTYYFYMSIKSILK